MPQPMSREAEQTTNDKISFLFKGGFYKELTWTKAVPFVLQGMGTTDEAFPAEPRLEAGYVETLRRDLLFSSRDQVGTPARAQLCIYLSAEVFWVPCWLSSGQCLAELCSRGRILLQNVVSDHDFTLPENGRLPSGGPVPPFNPFWFSIWINSPRIICKTFCSWALWSDNLDPCKEDFLVPLTLWGS